jgi:hypothetical protein
MSPTHPVRVHSGVTREVFPRTFCFLTPAFAGAACAGVLGDGSGAVEELRLGRWPRVLVSGFLGCAGRPLPLRVLPEAIVDFAACNLDK